MTWEVVWRNTVHAKDHELYLNLALENGVVIQGELFFERHYPTRNVLFTIPLSQDELAELKKAIPERPENELDCVLCKVKIPEEKFDAHVKSTMHRNKLPISQLQAKETTTE